MTREGFSNATSSTRSSRISDRKIREIPAKKVSRVTDVQKNNQLKYSFTGVPDTDPRACFNRSTWTAAVNMQQPPLGTSHLILGDQLGQSAPKFVDLLDHYGDGFWRCNESPVNSDGGADEPRRIPNVMILVGTNNISRSSDEEEAQWETMMVCLFTTLRQRFNCAVLTVCTVPICTKTLTATGRRHNEGVIRWNNIVRNLASRNARRMILIDIDHELRAMDQARLTSDGIHFDSIEGQAWLNRVSQERLDEIEIELFDTGVLKKEET